MFSGILRLFLGDKKTRTVKRYRGIVAKINEHYAAMDALDDAAVRAKTQEFKERLAQGETLDDLLPEAFAAAKQACKRLCGQSWEAGGNIFTWDIVPFDVQLMGGIALHQGNIAEMATGEGKTLVAVLPLYLNALAGKGAHLITVNDYLAKRDSQWMGKVFEFMGLSVGCILTDMTPAERRVSYASDVTYGTNNEFGFDYLRDNMALSPENLVQRGHYYAIVDEVDSVLIDEARTPLIISGQVDRSITQFTDLEPMVAELVRKQNLLVNELVGQAEDLLAKAEANGKAGADDRYEAGIKLLQSRKAAPKHRRLSKVMNDASAQRLVLQVENDFMRDKRVPELESELYFVVDEKGHTIDLTAKGREELSPSDPDTFLVPDLVDAMAEIESAPGATREQIDKRKEELMAVHERRTETIHAISQLLRAYTLYEKDVEYVVQDNKVIIVDEFTGRLMNGRRWSDGLHQAVESKEGVQVEKETQTLATITLQNYFRMYEKLAGMTGTAETEASEFAHTYKMDVVVTPTHRPVHRLDDNDLIYKSQREKYNAIVNHIKEVHESKMPVLVGTVSVDVSEKISRMLQREKISHSVLNAKQHAREAQIVREAGQTGAVTIATNMAGRGTDIKLGPGVIRCKAEGFAGPRCAICPFEEGKGAEADREMPVCGLHIVGTERHESRRIDRQLRGRSGRQGDPGYSLFYLSLEDQLMRLFASDRMATLMAKGFEEGEAMSHGIATRAISSAQKKIEERNFEHRKRTLDYDNVMNKQREAIYGFRRRILTNEGPLADEILEVVNGALEGEWENYGGGGKNAAEADLAGFLSWIRRNVPLVEVEGLDQMDYAADTDGFLTETAERILKSYERKSEVLGPELNAALSRWVLLQIIDTNWRDHLLAIDELREGIYLRSYAQLNPLTEYQREATLLFEDMMGEIYKEAFEHVFRATLVQATPEQRTSRVSFEKQDAAEAEAEAARQRQAQAQAQAHAQARAQSGDEGGDEGGAATGGGAPEPPRPQAPYRREAAKVGRNDPCPCGSGKKYKKCCGSPTAGHDRLGLTRPPTNGKEEH